LLSDSALLAALLGLDSRRLQTLAILHHLPQPARTRDLEEYGLKIGFRQITKWDVRQELSRAAKDGWTAQLPGGWVLQPAGLTELKEAGLNLDAPLVREARHSLRSHLNRISDQQRRAFVGEAIGCFDANHYRAAVVLTWVGAMHLLQEHIIKNHLTAFNVAGKARFRDNWKVVSGEKHFAAMQDRDVLEVCQDASILDKAEKAELIQRLDLRNRCGHPNAVSLAEHTVASHVEILILNVFAKY
jgi:hypothetical protein